MSTGMHNQFLKTLRDNRPQIVTIGIVAIFAAMLGCGGGGGGGGGTSATSTTSTSTTSTSTTSTSTTSTSTTSTSTTAGSTTSETTGTTGSTLPANRVFFLDTSQSVKHMNPDGTDEQIYTSIPSNFKGFAQSPVDPSVKAFAHTSVPDNFPTTIAQYEIYLNSSVSLTGAVKLTNFTDLSVNPTRQWADIGSIMFSPDGSKVFFTAARTQSDGQGGTEYRYRLYSVSTTAADQVPAALDDADDAFVAPTGLKIVYTYWPPGASNPVIRISNIDGSGKSSLTTNAQGANFFPQYNKDGTQICFVSNRTAQFEIWKMASNGSSQNQVTNINSSSAERCYGSSFSSSGSEIVFTRLTANSGTSGIYKVPSAGGTEVLIRADFVQPWVFWSPVASSMPSRAPGAVSTPLSFGTSKRMERFLGLEK